MSAKRGFRCALILGVAVLFLLSGTASVLTAAGFEQGNNSGLGVPSSLLPAVSPVNTVVATIPVGPDPHPGPYDTANGDLYVPNLGASSVSVISGATNTVVATVPVGIGPAGIVDDGANGDLYVANNGGNNVSVISGAHNTVVDAIPVGTCPNLPTPTSSIDPANGELFAANGCSNNVSVISGATSTVVATIPVGSSPHPGIYDGANGDVYVPNTASSNVSVISGATNTVIATVSVGSYPSQPVWDSANGDIYVLNYLSSSVSVISGATNTVVTTVPVGSGPWWSVTYDPLNGDLYTGNSGSNDVTVISGVTNTVVATVPVGTGPEVPAYDSANGNLYVPNTGSNNVSVISGATNTVVATVPVGAGPIGPVVDIANGDVYVPNTGSDNVSVIFGGFSSSSYSVKFVETGLPSGTEWFVNITGKPSVSSTGTTIVTDLSNGSYAYTIGSSNKQYRASGGTFTMDGKAISKSVRFVLVTYAVKFKESGLPSGTEWWVNLTNGQSFSTNTGTIGFKEPNSTYTYTIATSDKEYHAKGGAFTADGKGLSRSVKFSLVTYVVKFKESGLPPGTEWWVNLTNGQSFSTNTGTITFNEPNATYSYTVAAINKSDSAPGGSFTIAGAGKTVRVTFTT